MKENKIKVVIKEPNMPSRIEEIDEGYKVLQGLVNGLFYITSMLGRDDKIDIICNDEFLYNGSQPNIMVPEKDHIFCGTLIFAGYNPEDGSTISLNDEQIKTVNEYIDKNTLFNMDLETAYNFMQIRKAMKIVKDMEAK